MLLDTTRATDFVPGTNQRWQVTGANWTYLLPSLTLDRVLCVGQPTAATLATLRRIGGAVVVVPTLAAAATAAADAPDPGPPGSHAAPFDLVAVVDPRAAARVAADAGARAELGRWLAPGGRLYLDLGVHARPDGTLRRLRALTAVGWAGQALWLTPLAGEAHTAVPLSDRVVVEAVRRGGWYSLSSAALKRAAVGRLRRLGPGRARRKGEDTVVAPADLPAAVAAAPAVAPAPAPAPAVPAAVVAPANAAAPEAPQALRTARPARVVGALLARSVAWAEHALARRGWMPVRTAVLLWTPPAAARAPAEASGDGGPATAAGAGGSTAVGAAARPAGHPADGPPAYLQALAGAGGLDLRGWRWALSAKGEYSSRKVLFFLYPPEGAAPEILVKLTRDPALNPRLENERRALDALWAAGVGDAATLPRVRFHGHHGGLAVVGESVVTGVPFRARTRWAADCPHAAAAVGWLVDLSARTADRAAVPPAEAAAVLRDLFARFVAIYRLPDAGRARLEAEIARIAAHPGPFPVVFQHGDPGTWNLLATADGRAAFLDWEAAEARGMPLWDVFYFLRSFAVGAARAGGEVDVLRGVETHFIRGSHLTAWLADGIRRARDAAGVPAALVPALFLTCWMHRALKEATRLPAAKVETGHYVGLLRLCLDRADDAGLQRVLGVGDAGRAAS